MYKNGIDQLAKENKQYEKQFIEQVLMPMFSDVEIRQNADTYGKHDITLNRGKEQSLKLEFEVDWSASGKFSDMVKNGHWQRA